jgi:hypothetical protein
MYWQKDRYVYLQQEHPTKDEFIIFDKQTGDIYLTDDRWGGEWHQFPHFKKNVIKE